MSKIFYDKDGGDSFHILHDDSYETKTKLKEFIKWLKEKADDLENKAQAAAKKSWAHKEKEKIIHEIDKLNKKAAELEEHLEKEVSKEHLEREVKEAEEHVKKINEHIAKSL